MPRPARVNLPTGENASWLDMLAPADNPTGSGTPVKCPPKPVSKETSPPSAKPLSKPSKPRKPKPSPKLIARIKKIHEFLDKFEHDITVRNHLTKIYTRRGAYCLQCPPPCIIGSCGATCPLLRPPRQLYDFVVDLDWLKSTNADYKLYLSIVTEMESKSDAVYAATVGKWERAVEKLRANAENRAEMRAAYGWTDVPQMKYHVGMKRSWVFEHSWSEGRKVSIGIAPKDGPVAKRVKRS
jgi:hypothetical protein